MKSYFILNCPNQQKIADSLYGYYVRITANKKIKNFWNNLDREEIKNYFSIQNLELKKWFDQLDLRVRDMSFTIYNEEIQTNIHTDAPPVIAKINFPVLNTRDTYNVWYNTAGEEIDRVECIKPIVLRSDIPHTVEIGSRAKFPRIQFSFCFYKDPINLLM
jgi:PKD repeat protein